MSERTSSDILVEKWTSLLRTYRAGEADDGRQPALGRREAVGVHFYRERAGVGVDHRVGGRVQDNADVPWGGRGAVVPGEEDQVPGLYLAGRDLLAPVPLGLAGAGDGDPGGAVGHHGQARAVEGVRSGRSVLVTLPELGFGVGEDLPGGAGGQQPEGGLLAYGAAGGGDRLGAPGGVAGGLVQDVGDVSPGVVV